nr:polymorphic toxin-type HINT domain-containing protein [Amycolatopsis sp. SID8362]
MEAHPIDRVIVTESDHDFVDLKVKPNRVRRAASRVVAGLAVAAAVVTGGAATASAAPATLTTTFHHPFYDVTRGAFVEAVNLQVGDRLQTPDGGEATVERVTPYHSTEVTYDLTIDQLHTYYVAAGETPVLVHNCDPYVWKAGRPGVDNTPQGQLPTHAGIKPGEPLAEGDITTWSGRTDRFERCTTWALDPGAGHTSLSEGEPVHMAGTFDVDASGNITSFDNFSGHYQPSEMPGYRPLEDIARDAFAGHGLPAPQADAWSPYFFK